MTSDELETVMDKLAEHYDSVLLLCTHNEEGTTLSRVKRRGNYYASKGLAIEWLENEHDMELAKEIAHRIDGE